VHTGLDPRPYRAMLDVPGLKASLGVPADAPLVGTVGRLSPQKSPLDFVRMVAIVHKRLPRAHFVWIGSGPLQEAALQLSLESGLKDVLHFAGQRANVPDLLQALQCFVLTSAWEGFPLVLLEAMAAGAPVVATDIPGSDEAIRAGQDGLLVPVGDPLAMAQAVQDILENPQQAALYRDSASRRLEQEFTPRAMLDGLTDVYRQVVAARRAHLNVNIPNASVGEESL